MDQEQVNQQPAGIRLDTESVEAVLAGCLFTPEEAPDGKPPANAILVEGIVNNYAFHPERLEQVRPIVATWISLLPDQFLAGKGGGWSFLNLCEERDGNQWTSLHRTQEELFALAAGLGLARFILTREYWSIFPGGMPYVVFSTQAERPKAGGVITNGH